MKKGSEELEKEVARLKKINLALMKRVEAKLSDQKNAFSMFEGNILLEKKVKERTFQLEKASRDLISEKTKIFQLVKALPGNVLIFNSEFKILDIVKGRANDFFGLDPQLNIEHGFFQDFIIELERALKKLSSQISSTTFEYLHIFENESEVFFHCGISKLEENKFLLYCREDSEIYLHRKRIREQELQLAEASKLSSLGEMAGGVAHEINTPLGAILLAASQLKTSLSGEAEVNTKKSLIFVELIINTVDRISKIVKSLRQVSRDGSADELASCALADLIEDSVGLCRERFQSHGVALEIDVSEASSMVMVKRVPLSQVLLNLLNNSFYVAKEVNDGWIKIRCENTSDDRVRVSVIDCGKGIEPTVLNKIFQPFFTTKEVGEGTGLGMSISRQIVKEHGSDLRYQLNEGHTSFYFEIQQAEDIEVPQAA